MALKHDHKQFSKPTQQQVIIATVCITVLVTLYSLSELQSLLHTHSGHGGSDTKLPGQQDLGAATALPVVAAAGRPVKSHIYNSFLMHVHAHTIRMQPQLLHVWPACSCCSTLVNLSCKYGWV